MPTPDYRNAAQGSSIPPEALAGLQEQRRGSAIAGGGQLMSQHESALAARVSELTEEIRELRRMLAPPSAVILTGAEVLAHFSRLRAHGIGEGSDGR